MRRIVLIGIAVIAAAGAAGVSARPHPSWQMTDLGTLGGRFGIAWSINDRGDVVGTSRTTGGERDVFLWRQGRLEDIGRYGWDAWSAFGPRVNERGQVVWVEHGRGSVVWENGSARRIAGFTAAAVNDRGELAGRRSGGGAENVAALWENGQLRELGTLPGDRWSEAVAVNDSGAVAGTSYGDKEQHAFLWQNGSMRRLGSAVASASCYPVAINRSGQVLGWCTGEEPGSAHAFLWNRAGARDLGASMSPVALNDHGDAAGDCRVSGRDRACLWHDGVRRDLGTLGGKEAWVADLNDRGQVVGSSTTREGRVHAFVWEGGAMTDLGRPGPRSRSEANAIDDSGRIVGSSQTGDPPSPSGVPQRAALWTRTGS